MTPILDHLTILSRSPDKAAAFYGFLLPRLGFVQKKTQIWANPAGLHIQFGKAKEGTGDYGRYAPGLNHFGFAAPAPMRCGLWQRNWGRPASKRGSRLSIGASRRCSCRIPMA